MEFREKDGKKEFGLNSDEAQMAAFGYAGGYLISDPNRDIFWEAKTKFKDDAENLGINPAQLKTHMWLPIEIGPQVKDALIDHIQNVSGPVLEAQPSYREDSLRLHEARLAKEIASTAISQLEEVISE